MAISIIRVLDASGHAVWKMTKNSVLTNAFNSAARSQEALTVTLQVERCQNMTYTGQHMDSSQTMACASPKPRIWKTLGIWLSSIEESTWQPKNLRKNENKRKLWKHACSAGSNRGMSNDTNTMNSASSKKLRSTCFFSVVTAVVVALYRKFTVEQRQAEQEHTTKWIHPTMVCHFTKVHAAFFSAAFFCVSALAKLLDRLFGAMAQDPVKGLYFTFWDWLCLSKKIGLACVLTQKSNTHYIKC